MAVRTLKSIAATIVENTDATVDCIITVKPNA